MSDLALGYFAAAYIALQRTKREQFRFPRSHRRRIRKKWAKRVENWRSAPDYSLFIGLPAERVIVESEGAAERIGAKGVSDET